MMEDCRCRIDSEIGDGEISLKILLKRDSLIVSAGDDRMISARDFCDPAERPACAVGGKAQFVLPRLHW